MNPVNAHVNVNVSVGRREPLLPRGRRRRHVLRTAHLAFRKETLQGGGGGQRQPGLNSKGRTRDHKEMPSVRAKNDSTHGLVQAQGGDSRQDPLRLLQGPNRLATHSHREQRVELSCQCRYNALENRIGTIHNPRTREEEEDDDGSENDR